MEERYRPCNRILKKKKKKVNINGAFEGGNSRHLRKKYLRIYDHVKHK